MQISTNTSATMSQLVELGYRLTNVYGDESVRMSNGTVGVFIRPDGTVGPPHVHDTMVAQAELIGAGITIRYGERPESLSSFIGYAE